MNTKNEVFEYLIDQLRQQVNNNQCEDLAHEVLLLKNKLRDSSSLVKELYETISELQADLATATGDVEAFKRSRKGGYVSAGQSYVVGEHGPEQSGCCKDDTHECEHDWVLDEKGDYFVCYKCGRQEAELNACQHTNTVGLRKGFAPGFSKKCLDCGAKLK